MRRGTVFAISSLLLCAAAAGLTSSGTLLALSQHEVPGRAQRKLTLEERVSYQRAIEEVYWRHRIWPKERPDPKPSLDAVISQAQVEKKVESYLRNSEALEDYWQRPITAEQLQAEMDRMAQNTRQPEVLQELFEALGNDPSVIAECLARPMLAERLLAQPEFERVKQQSRTFDQTVAAGANYTLPIISDPSGGCIEDTWTPTNLTGAPDARVSHTAVWTGSEMIVWGGTNGGGFEINTGGRYNPSTDSWTATSTTNAPEARVYHTAVWTGSEMIVWGGTDFINYFNTGGRYNPSTDSWTATSTANVPGARFFHTAVWTGSEMIVWGGGGGVALNTGGRYNPSTNSWTATSTTNAPSARSAHTAVWTGSQMIVWGGSHPNGCLNTGGRYNPSTDSWTASSTINAPDARSFHTAVWTGSEMIVWGGQDIFLPRIYNSGGKYDPVTNSWTATSTGNAPDARSSHTAVWTGSNMIVWGGGGNVTFNSGGRYYPDIDLWVATSITNAPPSQFAYTAVWTGSEMIVWGGDGGSLSAGGRYCVPSGIPSPTPAPTPCPGGYAVCNPNDSGPGSLRQAILNASPGDTINFAPSVTTVNLTSGEELVIDKNLTITGPGANRLTVQRSTYAARIFNISSSTVTVSISGITISNGYTSDPGGGIRSAGVLTLTDCTISGNFSGTFAGFSEGGGVLNDHGNMTITGCTISNNSVEGIGGGVLNENGTMTITGCTISNNFADQSGYAFSEVSQGGGILNDSGGSLIITNSTISDNTSYATSLDVFGQRGFAYGGGVHNLGSMTITNCTISGNSAVGPTNLDTGYGGGISNGGNLQITSSTIAHNSATGGNGAFGGGIYGSTRTDSSIIALNSALTGPDFTGAGGLQSTGYNIIGNNADAVINSQPTDQIGTPASPIDPLLGPLADNGGPTFTYALQPGSVAINRGDPAAPPQDQRGYSRLGVPDVGAFEFDGFNGDYVLYQATTRRTAIWYLDNNIYQGSAFGPTLPPGWALIDVADFNGDSYADYALFNHNTRQTAIWYLNNNVYIGGAYGPSLPSGWQLVAVGDFNRDGKPDYVLYNPTTRQTAIWYLNNNVYIGGAYGPTPPAGWSVIGSADFNGDGKTDYLLFNSTTRQSAIWYLNNNVYVSGAYGPTPPSGWQLMGTADFDGDGKPDYALFNATTRKTAIWYLNDNVFVSSAYGPTLTAGWSLVAP